MFGFNLSELLVVFGIVLILFGPSRLPGLGESLGRAISGFRRGVAEDGAVKPALAQPSDSEDSAAR